MSINDDVIKPCIGKQYKNMPLFTDSIFLCFINNLMGLIPIFPGGANVTGNIRLHLYWLFALSDCQSKRIERVLGKFVAGCANVVKISCSIYACY